MNKREAAEEFIKAHLSHAARYTEMLVEENKRLKQENEALKQENEALKEEVEELEMEWTVYANQCDD